MAGRPPKIKNEILTGQIEQFRSDFGLSYSALAKKLDIHCSTLTRSVSTNLYSKDFEKRARRMLDLQGKDDESLLLLRKFATMLPEVASALASILDREVSGK